MTTTRCILLVPDQTPPNQGEQSWPIDARVSIKDLPAGEVWKSCQKLVEGYIEIVHLTEPERTPENNSAPFAQGWHLAAYVNEDGIPLGMTPNAKLRRGDVLFGPVVFVHERVDGEGDTHYRDVTEDDWERIRPMIIPLVPRP